MRKISRQRFCRANRWILAIMYSAMSLLPLGLTGATIYYRTWWTFGIFGACSIAMILFVWRMYLFGVAVSNSQVMSFSVFSTVRVPVDDVARVRLASEDQMHFVALEMTDGRVLRCTGLGPTALGGTHALDGIARRLGSYISYIQSEENSPNTAGKIAHGTGRPERGEWNMPTAESDLQ